MDFLFAADAYCLEKVCSQFSHSIRAKELTFFLSLMPLLTRFNDAMLFFCIYCVWQIIFSTHSFPTSSICCSCIKIAALFNFYPFAIISTSLAKRSTHTHTHVYSPIWRWRRNAYPNQPHLKSDEKRDYSRKSEREIKREREKEKGKRNGGSSRSEEIG